jgi:hypothetical protein
LVLDDGGIGIGLLKIEVGATESDGAMLEAWIDDVIEDLLGGHCGDIHWAMIGRKDICNIGAVSHVDQCLGKFDVVHQLEDSCTNMPWAKQIGKVETEADAHVSNVLLAAIGHQSVDDGKKYCRIAGNGGVIDDCPGTIVERWDLEVGRIKPAFLIDLGEVVDEAIHCGHAIELQFQSVKKDANVNVECAECALVNLICMGAHDNGRGGMELGIQVDLVAPHRDRDKLLRDKPHDT